MELRNQETGEIISDIAFRQLHSNTSFPKVITASTYNSFGYDVVLNGAQPVATEYQQVQRDGVELIEGQWFTKFIVVDRFVDDEESTAAEKIAAYEQGKVLTNMKAADYVGFWQALIRSTVYSTLKENAKLDLAANVLATELISLLGDAKTGHLDHEALQQGIWETVAVLTPELVTELEGLMATYGLDVYSLTQA